MKNVLQEITGNLNHILRREAEIIHGEKELQLVYANPSGGNPIRVSFRSAEEIKVILNKTPRYYQTDTASMAQMKKAIADYAEGKTVSLDFTDRDGNESRIDRLAKAADAEALTLSSLIDLSIRINLLNSVEIKDLLANGGTVNVNFWNRANNFRYRQIGSRLEKIYGTTD